MFKHRLPIVINDILFICHSIANGVGDKRYFERGTVSLLISCGPAF